MRPSLEAQPGQPWKPRDFLREAEEHAVKIRKLLRQSRNRKVVSKASASMDDALALADLVQTMARFGRRASAADATEIAERVELMLDMLRIEIHGFLTS